MHLVRCRAVGDYPSGLTITERDEFRRMATHFSDIRLIKVGATFNKDAKSIVDLGDEAIGYVTAYLMGAI